MAPKWWSVPSLITIAVTCLPLAAIPIVDQQQPVIDLNLGGLAIGGNSTQKLAQVVTAGLSGSLVEVRFPVGCDPGSDLTIQIQRVTAGNPNGIVLASQVFSSLSAAPSNFRSLLLATPVFFSTGEQFAITLTSPGSCGVFQGPVGDSYAGGELFFDALPNPPGWVRVCDFPGASCDLPFQTLVIATVTCPAITLSPTTLPGGAVGTPYSQTVSASGGTAPYTYAVSTGASGLPIGLSLNTTTGAIAGTPTLGGLPTLSFSFTITATDANGCSGSRGYSIVITACRAITLSPTTLPNGRIGTPYSQMVSASGGVVTSFSYTYSISGMLPSGLSLNTTTGAITGTPTTTGLFSFTITATDSLGCPGSQAYSISIASCPIITLSPVTLPSSLVGIPYSQTVSASGGTTPYTYSFSGTLPPGLSLNTATGAITGTPTAAGAFTFIITATDTNGCTGLLGYTVTMFAAVAGASIPTLSGWSLMTFILLIGLVSVHYLRRI